MSIRMTQLIRSTALAAALAVVASRAEAQAAAAPVPDDFYQTKNCNACHHMERTKYAPAFRKIAAKYAGDAGAEARLAAKVRAGGGGVWGADMMPPQAQVTEAEALGLVKWILALKENDGH